MVTIERNPLQKHKLRCVTSSHFVSVDTMEDKQGEPSVNDYEAKRRRRMEENQRMLQSLNLPSLSRPRTVARPQPRKEIVTHTEPRRQSERQQILSRKRRAQAKLDQEKNQRQNHRQEQVQREKKLHQARKQYPPVVKLPPVYLCQLTNAPRGAKQERLPSSRLTIDVDDFHWRCLGRQILPVGKQTVMQGLCPDGFVPWYPHKSNVQPWRNAVALFVDVDAETDSTYTEMFREDEIDGRRAVHFQWRGQSQWKNLTPTVVWRLQQTQRGDHRLRFDESYYDVVDTNEVIMDPLLLFIQHKKGPYIYCGRLGYLGHQPSSSPLEFRWQLLDVDHLDWNRVRDVLAADLSNE